MQTVLQLVRGIRDPWQKLLQRGYRQLTTKLIATIVLAVICGGLIGSPSAIAAEFAIAPDADLVNGAAVFEATCAGCHVNGGNILRRGKNLKARALARNQADSLEAISAIVMNGQGIMSAYGDRLSADEIRDVASYVLDRANSDWK
ncbi:MAG: c-type cytochrome [Coleofasciculaceae cyanobacterium RL_1_1]|nr:c-type cytochrome [Coleofasciculaceae cyanobacterium RL_1_1]